MQIVNHFVNRLTHLQLTNYTFVEKSPPTILFIPIDFLIKKNKIIIAIIMFIFVSFFTIIKSVLFLIIECNIVGHFLPLERLILEQLILDVPILHFKISKLTH